VVAAIIYFLMLWPVVRPLSRLENRALAGAMLANFMGSMKEAFKDLRSASVTPRATEQAPQTKIGTFPLITLSINSGSGGKPTP
jgi:hypothetical protein